MPLGAPASNGSGGDNITHFGGVRLRATGAGNLRISILSQDDVVTNTLVPVVLSSTNKYSPLRLANTVTQHGKVKIETTAVNETFRINRIIVYAKTLWTMVPG